LSQHLPQDSDDLLFRRGVNALGFAVAADKDGQPLDCGRHVQRQLIAGVLLPVGAGVGIFRGALMVKTQAYHWNAVGPLFHSLHLLTEEQYNNLFGAIDEMAERVRALGYPAPYSITDMISHSEISENVGNPTTEQMIANLVKDHEIAARRFRQSVARAEEASDVVTADMLTARMAFHEKAIWMLSALLAR